MINQTANNIIDQLYDTIYGLETLKQEDILQQEDLKSVLNNLEKAYYAYLLLYNSLNGPVAMSGYMPVEKATTKESEKL